jgi:hypothetical protein
MTPVFFALLVLSTVATIFLGIRSLHVLQNPRIQSPEELDRSFHRSIRFSPFVLLGCAVTVLVCSYSQHIPLSIFVFASASGFILAAIEIHRHITRVTTYSRFVGAWVGPTFFCGLILFPDWTRTVPFWTLIPLFLAVTLGWISLAVTIFGATIMQKRKNG